MTETLQKRAMARRAFLLCACVCAWVAPMHLALADYAKIVESGALKVAVYKSFAPFSEPERGDAGGLDVALAGALARELGVKLSLMPFDAGETMSDDLRNMVWRGHYLGYGPADVMLHVPVDRRFMERNDRGTDFRALLSRASGARTRSE